MLRLIAFGTKGLPRDFDVGFGHVERRDGATLEFFGEFFGHLVHELLLDFLVRVQPIDVGLGRLEDVVPVDVGVPQAKPACVVPKSITVNSFLFFSTREPRPIIWW